MDYILSKYCPRIEFDSYEDFYDNFKIDVPENFNFAYDVVDEWARVEPDKKALVWINDAGEEREFTFTDISLLSNRAANAFRKLGIRKGDIVMLMLRRRWEYWVCAMALCKIGASIIPATIQLTSKDIAYRANSAAVKMLICVDDDYVVEQVEGALPNSPSIKKKVLVAGKRDGWLSFDELIEDESDQWERPAGEDATQIDDIMLIYFTSGTTGNAKAVEHSFKHPLGHILTAKYWQQVRENRLHMSVTDSGWAKFGWGKIYGQWIAGAAIFAYDMDKFVPAKLLQVMQDYDLATFCAPPTMYRFMLQEDVAAYDLSSIENFATAGEPLNGEVTIQWEKLTGKKIREGFGQTETTLCCLTAYPWMQPRLGSMGLPAPGWRLVICDANDEEVPAGVTGEICVRTDGGKPFGLFGGYFRDEELTRKAWHDDLYHTGDTAYKDELGFLWYVGRVDDVIKSSGYRIGPFEIESVIMELPYVLECAVSPAPDEIRGQVVKASIVLTKGTEPSENLKKEIQTYVKQRTAPYKYPRIVVFRDDLPKTISGKIIRHQL